MQEVGLEQVRCGLYLEVVAGGGAGVVSCPASFHSHAEEKSLVKCLFNFCSVRQDLGAPIRLQNVGYVIRFAKGIIQYFAVFKLLRE